MTGFKAISFTEEKVGKHIKASKKKYSWLAMIDQNELRVELFVSKLSRKVKLFINKDLVHHGKLGKGHLLQFSQEYFGRQVHVLQQGKMFDLRVDSVSFQHIFQQNRNKEEFRYEFQKNDLRDEEHPDVPGETPALTVEEKLKKAYNPFDEPQDEQKPFDEPQRTYNPFDELFEQPKPVKENENKQKLKPFSIKPPAPASSQPKAFGIFQPPELQPAKTNLDGNLFENPSKPVNKAEVLKFPEAENPFMTGNFNNRAGPPMGNQFYTGNYYK
jgi:hypothetical protein